MSGPVFYESKDVGLSTERGYFENDEDFGRLLRASETDTTRQSAVIHEVIADRDAWIGRFRDLEADRDAWVGYFKGLEADRDTWVGYFKGLEADRDAWVGYFKELEADRDARVARYENIRSLIIAYKSDTPSRADLVRELSAERDAAEVARRG